MLTRLKPHLNASTAIAFLALCLAISGGAFAATNHASNKTNSLTATTAKSSKGKTGARGPAGPAGPKGASGATGATGATGPVGAIGPAGPAGPAGTNASEVGPAGPAGASVLISALGRREHGCEEGGTLFKVGGTESTACNGESIAGTSVTSKEIKLGETTCNKVGGAEYTAYEDNKTTICNGTDGESVTSRAFEKEQEPVGDPCKDHGGTEFIAAGGNKTYACNGEEGSGGGGGYTEILPEGKTETGTWGASFSAEGLVSSMISFPIRLGKALAPTAVHYVPVCTSLTGERQAECETVRSSSIASCSGSAEAPTAAEGSLCLYQGGTEEPEGTLALDVPRITLPGSSYNGTAGAGTAGAVAFIHYEGPPAEADSAKLLGSWAVTAPAP